MLFQNKNVIIFMKTTHFHSRNVHGCHEPVSPKNYERPKLKRVGKVNNLTLKTGSISDFGGNKYTP